MPKRHQQHPAKSSRGRNNPEKSTVITTGTPKKQETYQRQAAEHQDTARQAQEARVPPGRDPSMSLTHEADSQARMEDRTSRSGSESNATTARKGSVVHETQKDQNQPAPPPPSGEDYAHDLAVGHHPAEHRGLGEAHTPGMGYAAVDIKELHTRLADLTDDELRRIQFLPTGTRLEQGAKYIDLNHLELGEFVVQGDMVAGPDNYYVPKKETDYVLWNRLNQVSNPERLDEPGTAQP